jgi:hypothetical protein
MKKIIFVLICCLAPMTFWSCDDSTDGILSDVISDVTGGIKITLGGTSYSMTAAGFYTSGGKTYVASTTGSNSVAIMLNGTTAKTYTLGFGTSLEGIITGSTSDMSSTLAFVPSTDASSDSYIVVAGTCTVSSMTSSKIAGTFSGYAIKSSELSSGVSLSTLTNLKTVSGSFTAISTSSIASK